MIKNKLLLIEDDEDTLLLLKEFLEEYDYKVSAQTTVTDALSNLSIYSFDIIILDLGLPDFSGYEILKYAQINNLDIPIIIISARSDKKSKLYAFQLGAIDYMIKPIYLEELEVRIRIHLRKKPSFVNTDEKVFEIKNNCIYYNSKQLNLTKIEFEILEKLINNKNTPLTRDLLCESLSTLSSSRSLDYHVKNIRIKLNDDGLEPKYLVTEYGYGYKLIF